VVVPAFLGGALRIESVTISGFRCFGPQPVRIDFAGDLTAVVGSNASGKTALLQALVKCFGVTRTERAIEPSDFHVAIDEDPAERKDRELAIDVIVALPEFAQSTPPPTTIAQVFRHMRIERPEAIPVCRIRLEARWEDDGTTDGELTQELFWIDTLDESVDDDKRSPLTAADRALIQLLYTPASRDAARQIKATTGALAARLLRAIEWSDETKSAVDEAQHKVTASFDAEAAIKAISTALDTRWSKLHDDESDTDPHLRVISRQFDEVVRRLSVVFQRGPAGIERGLESLSEGQQSLFYFALAAAVFDLEREAVSRGVKGFDVDAITVPALTLFAIEEPENHLAPFYLARIVSQVRSLVVDGAAQAVITSHSPAVLSRVEPQEVRYCRRDLTTHRTSVRAISLPEDDEEASKFVRGAMLAYPELYFARFVVLVEGDSERVVLPRLARAMDLLIDPAFVAIVPLGGRHVQHFWRLLTALDIPHATLLDLDVGREGGGFGRIKTTMENLLEIGVDEKTLLDLDDGTILPRAELAKMHTWEDLDQLDAWVASLTTHAVFFSSPLDIDLAMLAAFPDAYSEIIPKGGGPRMTVEKAADAVLGETGLSSYDGSRRLLRDFFPAYRYHFLTHSKPATHLRALATLDDATVKAKMASSLRAVLMHVQQHIRRD
jgi:putative ATP-dependent endonuclease of the OLD family